MCRTVEFTLGEEGRHDGHELRHTGPAQGVDLEDGQPLAPPEERAPCEPARHSREVPRMRERGHPHEEEELTPRVAPCSAPALETGTRPHTYVTGTPIKRFAD